METTQNISQMEKSIFFVDFFILRTFPILVKIAGVEIEWWSDEQSSELLNFQVIKGWKFPAWELKGNFDFLFHLQSFARVCLLRKVLMMKSYSIYSITRTEQVLSRTLIDRDTAYVLGIDANFHTDPNEKYRKLNCQMKLQKLPDDDVLQSLF